MLYIYIYILRRLSDIIFLLVEYANKMRALNSSRLSKRLFEIAISKMRLINHGLFLLIVGKSKEAMCHGLNVDINNFLLAFLSYIMDLNNEVST